MLLYSIVSSCDKYRSALTEYLPALLVAASAERGLAAVETPGDAAIEWILQFEATPVPIYKDVMA